MRTIPLLVFCLCSAGTVSGQGTVDFRNGGITFPTTANRYVYAFGPIGPGDATDAARRLTGTNYCAGLWYVVGLGQTDMDSGTGGMMAGTLFNFRSPLTADVNKGTWVVPVGSSPSFVLAGVLPGESATLQVRVWDYVKYGRTEAGYLAALAAQDSVGYSQHFDYTVPLPGSTPDKYYMDNFRAMVPEPSAILLGALSAAGALFLRRRRKTVRTVQA